MSKGLRYIVTTTDNIYVTPSVKIQDDKKKLVFPNTSSGAEFVVQELELAEVVSVVKESFTTEDITEELIV